LKKTFFPLILLAACIVACRSPVSPGTTGSSPSGTTASSPPGIPGNVHIVTVTGNNVLEWNLVTGATSYNVYFSLNGSSYGASTGTVTSAQYDLPLYGYYEVSAVNAAGEGSRSAGVNHPLPSGLVAVMPTFSPIAGNFTSVQTVTISSTTSGASIYYTTDGSTPIIGVSPLFPPSTPITVASGQTITITAIATASGYSNSNAASGIFHVLGWSVVGSAGFTGGIVAYTTIALNGYIPYIAYEDGASSNKASVQRFSGGAWSIVGTQGFSASTANYLTLSLYGGNPYVAMDSAGLHATAMAYSSTNGWQLVGASGISGGLAVYPSLAVYNGTPYVAFNNGASVIVMYYSGGWNQVSGADFPAGTGSNLSLAISSTGELYVAYPDSSGKGWVMSFNGSSWSSVGGGSYSSGTVSFVSLAVSPSDGTLYVAYQDGASDGWVMSPNGSAWLTVGGASFSSGTVSHVSPAVSSGGVPYVAYGDVGNGSRASVMFLNGSTWSTVGSVDFSAGTASYMSLSLDSGGEPYVVFQDGANGNKATVMTFK